MAKKRVTITVALREQPALEGLKSLTDKFLDFSKRVDPAIRVVGVGMNAVTAVVGGTAGAMANATVKAVEFDKALRAITTIADQAAFPMEKITSLSFEMANLYGGTVTEHARTLYEIISAGATSSAAATETLHVANKLAIGGLAQLGSAVTGLTSVTNAYAQQGITATEVADAMFVAAADGSTNIEALASSVGMVAPMASAVGLSVDEMTGALAALTLTIPNTSTAAEYLRSALANVVKPSQEAQGIAKKLGIDFRATALATKGLAQFLQDVVIKSAATKEQLARLFGDVGALNAVLALTNDGGAKLGEVLGHMEVKAGSTQAAFDKMSDSLGFQMDRYSALSDAAVTALGTSVASSESARDGLSAISDALAVVTDYFKSDEGKQAVNQWFDGLIMFTATAIRGMAHLADAVTSPVNEMRKAWAYVNGEVYSEQLTVTAKLIDESLNLADALEKVASHGTQGVRFAKDEPAEQMGPPKPRPGLLKPPEPDREKKKPKARGDADEHGDAMVALFREHQEREDAMASLQERELEARRAFARQIEESRRAQNTAEVDANNEGLRNVADYARGLTSELEGLGELLAGDITTGAADALAGITDMVGSAFASMVASVADGSASIGEALAGFIGQIITNLGMMLIQLGTAALLANALSAIPIFAPLVGAPGVGAGVALAAIAGGAVMVGIGTAISGAASSAGGGGGGAAAGGGGGGAGAGASGYDREEHEERARDRDRYSSRYRDERINGGAGPSRSELEASGVGRRGVATGGDGPRTIIINNTVEVGRHAIVGSSAQAGREVGGWLNEATRLGGRRALVGV